MMFKRAVVIILLLFSMNIFSLKTDSLYAKFGIGGGYGLDYSGIGLNLSFYVHENASVVFGFGNNFHKMGPNATLNIRLSANSNTRPFVGLNYGYNAVILSDNKSLEQTFYGISVIGGLEMHFKSPDSHFIKLAVIYPIQSEGFNNAINDIRNKYGANSIKESFTILISLGFHFIFEAS